ncbi:MAG: VOC family protein [Hyphomicrobiaceae bacterium]|nr:VOC family protein [Hyphomicrobiaceae bacterium]
MSRMIFVNLPVRNLEASKAFYEALGFRINPQFTDETAACVVISETIHVMLLTHDKMRQFTTKDIADATKTTEVLVALSAETRDEVDSLVGEAVKAGGQVVREPNDYGFMYQHAFEDPDGHIWEIVWMDPNALATHA